MVIATLGQACHVVGLTWSAEKYVYP